MAAGSIVIDLLMRTGSFETDTARAERRLKQFKKEASDVGKFLGGAFALAAGVVTAAFGAMVSRSREAIDSQAKLAAQLRTTYSSLEVLGRAGELAGLSMQQIGAAGRQLEINLGRAEQGVAAQADALDKLGLSADALSKVPLDQRILLINKALKENVKESERAAVAADLFGARNGVAIQTLDAGTIAEAARQVEIFGLNLSDVDAAKVEQANDAMSVFKLAAKGVGDQLTVALAPILKGLGDTFLKTAEEAGGMGTIVEKVFSRMIDAAGFVADAFAGVKRTVVLLADAFIISLNTSLGTVGGAIATFMEGLDRIPGLDLTSSAESVRAFAEQSDAVVTEAWANINRTLEEPLPSESLKKWVAEAVQAGQTAAEAAVEARKSVSEVFETQGGGKDVKLDSFSKQIIKDLEDSFKEANKFVDQTRSEIERLEAQIARVQELGREGFFAPGVEDDVLERLNLQLDETKEKLKAIADKEQLGAFAGFADEAARNMQDAFANYLFDPFDQGLGGMLTGFLETIQRMIAEVAASEILKQLFSGLAGSSNSFLSSIGGAFGGARASGGPVSAGRTYLVGERGPELFTPNTAGAVLANGSGGGGVDVQVIDQRGAGAPPVDVQRQLIDGRERMRIMIRSEVMGAISDGSAARQFAAAGYSVPRGGSR